MSRVSVVMPKIEDETTHGELKNWGEIIEGYKNLITYAVRLTRDPVEAEDLVQEAIYLLLKTRVTPESTYNYLCRIIRNVYVDKFHKRRHVQLISIDDKENKELYNQLVNSPVNRIENDLYYKELIASSLVLVLLKGLNEKEKNIYLMNVVEEMSAKEIAAVLDADVNLIRYELNRINAKLRYRARQLRNELL